MQEIDFSRYLEVSSESSSGIKWKIYRGGRMAGWDAGYLRKDGYYELSINKKHYFCHRIVWELSNGRKIGEKMQIDHIDGNRANNKPDNLREATRLQNNYNMKLSRANTSGVKGVCWNSRDRKWQARIKIAGKNVSLGVFPDIKDAEAAIRKARPFMHGDFARHEISESFCKILSTSLQTPDK